MKQKGIMTKYQVHRHIVLGGRIGGARLLLAKLTDCEWQALAQWCESQPTVSGSVNLMRWPGWVDAALRIEADSVAAWGIALDLIERIKSKG